MTVKQEEIITEISKYCSDLSLNNDVQIDKDGDKITVHCSDRVFNKHKVRLENLVEKFNTAV